MKSVSLEENLVPTKPKEVIEHLGEYNLIELNSAKRLLKKHATDSLAYQRFEVIDRLGSNEPVYSTADCGLFATILMAYNYHWNLRTSPEDWWFCVTRRVAIAIDKNSNKDSVRQMFVYHEGKKTLQVDVPTLSIHEVDYNWFFNEMSKKISENVKVPEYVDAVTADFSVTTAVQKIVSQITLMSSVQAYFEYAMRTRCGIPGVEMLGTEEDWKRLLSKLKVLRTLLEPIENDIGLGGEWWDLVEKVFRKLLATYQGKPDKRFWSFIVSYEEAFKSGDISGYSGWITQFMEGTNRLLQTRQFTSGLVKVPLTITDPYGVKDTAILVAGMLGFMVHEDDTSRVPSVQPFQGWSILLHENSPFRQVQPLCSRSLKRGGNWGPRTRVSMGRKVEEKQAEGDRDQEKKAQKGDKRENTNCNIS